MKKYLLSLLLLAGSVISAIAQVETAFYEEGITNASTRISFLTKMVSTEKARTHLISEKKVQEKITLLKTNNTENSIQNSICVDTSFTLDDGEWTSLSNGRVWSMVIQSNNAKSITLVFDDLTLKNGAELYIVNDEQDIVFGPITNDALGLTNNIVSDIMAGSKVRLYLYEPNELKGTSSMIITRVIHGSRSFEKSAYIRRLYDVACYPIWIDSADGVGVVIAQDGSISSGSLVMSTDFSFKPYFYTQYKDDSNYLSAAYKFRSRKESCGGSTNVISYTYYGAVRKAKWENNKFALLELNSNIQKQPDITWLGWDRSSNTPSSCTGFGINSLQNLVVAFKNGAPETGTIDNIPATQWLIYEWDTGSLDNHNEGAPLLNQDKRIVGHLNHRGQYLTIIQDTLGLQDKHYYGMFNTSWSGGGANNSRLSNWLDPNSSGVMTTNSAHPPYISGSDFVCNAEVYTLNNCPTGASVVWEINNESTDYVSMQQNTPNTNQCTIIKNYDYPEKLNIRAKIYINSNNVFTAEKNDIVIGTPNVGTEIVPEAPNGTMGCWSSDMAGNTFTVIDACVWPFDRIEARLYRLDNNFNPSQLVNSWNNISINNQIIPSYSPGWYLFQLRGHNECGYSDWLEQEVEFIDFSWLDLMIDYDSSADVIKISQYNSEIPVKTGNYKRQSKVTKCELQIWNSNNTQIMKKIKVDTIPSEISLSGIQRGVYIARLVSNGKTYSRKFVKQ